MICFPCRHHVAELVLGIVIKLWEGKSSGPTVKKFEDFEKNWKTINQRSFEPYLDGSATAVKNRKKLDKYFCVDDTIAFIESQLDKKQIRDDYKELLLLALSFLGKRQSRMSKPGCTSRARWMQKAIYSLKMYLFRKQTEIDDIELLEDICLFIVIVYIPYWYDCTTSTHTLKNDIDFIKKMKDFNNVNEEISKASLNQFTKGNGGHLWYMGYHLSALGFFDERITIEDKRKMVADIHTKKKDSEDDNRRLKFSETTEYEISDSISEATLEFFEIMYLDHLLTFLDKDPEDWENDESYRELRDEILYLHVVNDAAERALSGINKIRSINETIIQNTIISKSYKRKKAKENNR